jgi:hypothetical protein
MATPDGSCNELERQYDGFLELANACAESPLFCEPPEILHAKLDAVLQSDPDNFAMAGLLGVLLTMQGTWRARRTALIQALKGKCKQLLAVKRYDRVLHLSTKLAKLEALNLMAAWESDPVWVPAGDDVPSAPEPDADCPVSDPADNADLCKSVPKSQNSTLTIVAGRPSSIESSSIPVDS